eukprot:12774640-Alexandrium_andersonii.AAC.1
MDASSNASEHAPPGQNEVDVSGRALGTPRGPVVAGGSVRRREDARQASISAHRGERSGNVLLTTEVRVEVASDQD